MDGEIVLDRGETNVMKLDDDEQRLMDEIQISTPVPKKAPRPGQNFRPRAPPVMEHQEEIDAFVNPNKHRPSMPQYNDDDDDNDIPIDDGDDYDYGDGGEEQHASYQEEQPSRGYKTIDEEKSDLLNKLARLERKGFNVNKRLNAYSPIEDLRSEYKRITYTIDVDQSIKFSRRALMATVTGLEWANKRYNPFELQLDGWSESIMENLDDYDGVFEELHVKYGEKMQVAPEVKLLMMMGGSAMMFHLTNSMFKAAIPNMSEVLKQNPGLQQSMVQAVQNTRPKVEETAPAPSSGGTYEMQGPGIDISSLMGNIMMPPPPMNTTTPVLERQPVEDVEDDISDIVTEEVLLEEQGQEQDDVKEVTFQEKPAPKKRGRKKKTEINL
jgi:hypothetical protein